jgi:peptidoglycan/LPS O-acetylase OafA/YrhL
MEKKSLGFKYLDHVDALRAISVILVILFHLNSKLFSFGYLGVDIFFVISGYVITNSLYNQQIKKKDGIFYFYLKRIKRIFPILFLVIFSFLITYIFLSPLKGDTNFFLESSISALVGVSNLYFINNEINYFFIDQINPLLHTWSLGIEEQFYLVYPILLISIFKFLKGNTEKISGCLMLLIIVSFMIYYFEDGFFGDFYSPLARFWEIGLGCFAFFYTSISIKYKNILFYIFCFALFFLIINFQNEKIIQYSNLFAALISFIFIVKFRNIKNINFNLIIEKIGLPYLGKISYSLYLWHLPVLYFCEIYFSEINLYINFFIISLILSVSSYHFYENPIRKSKILDQLITKLLKNLHYTILFFFIIFITGSYGLRTVDALDFLKNYNYPEQKLQKFLTRLDYNYSNHLKAKCKNKENLNECIKDADLKSSIYLTGDSHADHFLIAIDAIDEVNPYFFNNFAQCEIIYKSMYHSKKIDSYDNCKIQYKENYKKTIIEKLNNTQNKTIIISLRLSAYLSSDWKLMKNIKSSKKDSIISNYQEFIDLFGKKNIVLVTTVPESEVHTEKCIFNEYLNSKINMNIYNKCHFKKSIDQRRYNEIKEILFSVASNKTNVRIYDPYPILCPTDICHNYNKESDFFMLHDKDHLSIEASNFISNDLSIFLLNNFN